jgi:hypothetical protein
MRPFFILVIGAETPARVLRNTSQVTKLNQDKGK